MSDEFVERAGMFDHDDIEGGLIGVQPPDDYDPNAPIEKVSLDTFKREPKVEINPELMDVGYDLDADPDVPDIGYKTDEISVKLTPEQVVILSQILKQSSFSEALVPYIDTELKFDIYEQQGYIRDMVGVVDDTLNEYVVNKEYDPFTVPWFKRIGKGKVRNNGRKRV